MKTQNEITLNPGDDLNQIINSSSKPVLVKFYADWCGVCAKLGPVIHSLQEKSNNKFIVVKVNVDDHQELSEEYNISGIPYVVVYKDRKKINDFTGYNVLLLNNIINQLKI